ncbi:MAG TPA: xanthine dehydrogenase family protein molybdopterin-binding subunit [Syntrophales bacterium]|nr:xanthine dehydrogenase family protein molybdopterin-binding subunit [Syntrophales bacterium]
MEKYYNVIGKPRPLIDASIKATGQGMYGADMAIPNMLWGKILRSPYPHAKILNINTDKAKKLRGVKAVITSDDALGAKYGPFPEIKVDKRALTSDKARYIGDEIAAVAAIDEDVAEEALDLIEVDYEILPSVFDPEKAIEPGAPLIHEGSERNISLKYDWHFGDIEKGFSQSDYIREDRFVTQKVTHSPMETSSAIASFDPDGRLTMWICTQDFYFLRRDISAVLGLEESKIRLIKPPCVGGGFGNRAETGEYVLIAPLLARKAGKPVKVSYTREEQTCYSRCRHPMVIELKTGVKKDGTLMAYDARLISNTGGYNTYGVVATYLSGSFLIATYKVPNVRYDGACVYTNTTIGGAMRGHGALQPRFACDSQLDMIAEELGLDPLEIRIKNAYHSGDVSANKFHFQTCGMEECLKQVAEKSHWEKKRGNLPPFRGIGMAGCCFLSGGNINPGITFSPIVKIYYDEAVSLITGATDIGQGCNTTLAAITAEELGVGMEDIRVIAGDTDINPIEPGSYSSRVTVFSGNGAKMAASDAKRQILEVVAEAMEANPEDLVSRDRRIYVKGDPGRGMTFSQAISLCYEKKKLPIIGKGHYVPLVPFPNFLGGEGDLSPAYSFGASVAEVEVDPETGKVKVLNFYMAHDCGFVINPLAVAGQLEGSTHMGLGYALSENIGVDDQTGQIMNTGFLDYKILLAPDMPKVQTIAVETIDPNGPFGAKEAGEGTTISPAPAIANAIYDAIGVRIKELPITPEKILKALEEKGSK